MNDSFFRVVPVFDARHFKILQSWGMIAASISVVLGIHGSLVAAAETSVIQEIAAIIPDASPLVIIAPNVEELEKSWKKTSFFQLYREPAMQPYWNELKSTTGGILPNDRLGLTWSELRTVTSSGATLVAWPTPSKSLASVLIIDASSRPDLASTARDLIRQVWQKRGYEVSAGKRKNVDLFVADISTRQLSDEAPANSKSKSSVEKPASAPSSWRYVFSGEGRVVVCDHDTVVGDILERMNGKRSDSLLKSESFGKMFDQSAFAGKTGHGLYWFVDPWQLFRAVVDPNARANRATMRTYHFLQRQGFDAVKAFGGVIDFGTSSNDVEYETRIVVKQPLKKGAELLSFVASSDLKTPTWLPATLTEVSSITLRPQSVVKAYSAVYDELYGENYEGAFKELLESIETEPDGPEARVRRDLLDCLQPQVILGGDFLGQKTETNPSGKRQLTVFCSSCPEKSLVALKRFFANDDQIQGHADGETWLWQSKEQDQALFPYNSNNPFTTKTDAVAACRQYIIMASDRSLAREAIQRAAGAGTGKVLPSLFVGKQPDEICGRLSRDPTAQLRADFEVARQGKLHKSGSWDSKILGWLTMLGSPKSDDAKLNEKLPKFEDLKTKFGAETREVKLTSSGWTVRGALKKHGTGSSDISEQR